MRHQGYLPLHSFLWNLLPNQRGLSFSSWDSLFIKIQKPKLKASFDCLKPYLHPLSMYNTQSQERPRPPNPPGELYSDPLAHPGNHFMGSQPVKAAPLVPPAKVKILSM